MSSYNPTTFTKPGLLKRMDPKILRQLFEQFPAFFRTNGLDLREIPKGQKLPYSQIAGLLAAAPNEAPDLADALYLIDELASGKMHDQLQEAAKSLEISDPLEDKTEADLATLVWLKDPAVLQRLHASTYLDRQGVSSTSTTRIPTASGKGHRPKGSSKWRVI